MACASRHFSSRRLCDAGIYPRERANATWPTTTTSETTGRARGRPGRGPFVKARRRQARFGAKAARLARKKPFAKQPRRGSRRPASGRSATSSATGRRQARRLQAPAGRSRLPSGRSEGGERRSFGDFKRPTAGLREAAIKPGGDKPLRRARIAIAARGRSGFPEARRAPTATGRSTSVRTSAPAGPQAMQLRPSAMIARIGPAVGRSVARPGRSSAGSFGRSRPFTLTPAFRRGGRRLERAHRQAAGARRHRLAPRRRGADRRRPGQGQRRQADLAGLQRQPVRHDRARRRRDPADRAHAAVPVPQAGRRGHHQSRSGGPHDGVRRAAEGPAAADDDRPARHQHRRPAAADQ